MKIFFTNTFKKAAKKLRRNQISPLEDVIEKLQNDPFIGEMKLGDLAGIRVYKFHILHQLILLAYIYNKQNNELMLLSFASHENFYENLKKKIHH